MTNGLKAILKMFVGICWFGLILIVVHGPIILCASIFPTEWQPWIRTSGTTYPHNDDFWPDVPFMLEACLAVGIMCLFGWIRGLWRRSAVPVLSTSQQVATADAIIDAEYEPHPDHAAEWEKLTGKTAFVNQGKE